MPTLCVTQTPHCTVMVTPNDSLLHAAQRRGGRGDHHKLILGQTESQDSPSVPPPHWSRAGSLNSHWMRASTTTWPPTWGMRYHVTAYDHEDYVLHFYNINPFKKIKMNCVKCNLSWEGFYSTHLSIGFTISNDCRNKAGVWIIDQIIIEYCYYLKNKVNWPISLS